MRKQKLNADALLKLLLQSAGEEPFRQMHIDRVEEWLNVDLPRIRSRRVDLLGRTAAGQLVHVEFQGTNDSFIPIRMAEYGLAILRAYGEYPQQLVIYVGKEKLRMKQELRTSGMVCAYRLVDIRALDSAALLASGRIADNLLGLLAGLEDSAGGIRKILRRILKLKKSQQEDAWRRLLLTCELRGLEDIAEKERQQMPVDFEFDLTRYKFIAVEVEKGRLKGNREIVRRQLEKRFGRLPASVTRRLAQFSRREAQELALAVLDAKSLEELFGRGRRKRADA